MGKRGRYTREFKLEALRLLSEGKEPVADIARALGVKRTLLYRWRDQVCGKGEEAFRGSGRPKLEDRSELSRVKQELKDVTEERDILKKAVAYFARDHK